MLERERENDKVYLNEESSGYRLDITRLRSLRRRDFGRRQRQWLELRLGQRRDWRKGCRRSRG